MAISGGSMSMTTGMGIGDAIGAGAQAIGAGVSYYYQSKIIDIQKNLMMDKIEHGSTMSKIETDDQLNHLNQKEKNLNMAQEMHGHSLAKKGEVKKLEAEGRILDTQKQEHQLTEKQGKINDHGLRVLFHDYRGRYPNRRMREMGQPAINTNR
ncbi:MAG: hypothetical protein HN337_04405 [Deltaproteobacteria bacterium]|jgi:hypothetical protein|nr:hypothetical protein [Deltaproteobacteria bacterium]